jgi:hypothetical protein
MKLNRKLSGLVLLSTESSRLGPICSGESPACSARHSTTQHRLCIRWQEHVAGSTRHPQWPPRVELRCRMQCAVDIMSARIVQATAVGTPQGGACTHLGLGAGDGAAHDEAVRAHAAVELGPDALDLHVREASFCVPLQCTGTVVQNLWPPTKL